MLFTPKNEKEPLRLAAPKARQRLPALSLALLAPPDSDESKVCSQLAPSIASALSSADIPLVRAPC